MDSVIVATIFPLFSIMFAGYLAGRSGLFSKDTNKVLSRFVFYVSMPALIFVSLARVDIDQVFDWPFLQVLGGGMFAMLCLGAMISRLYLTSNLAMTGFHGLSVMFSSTAYIGLPIVLSVFGDKALIPGIIGAVITGSVFMPIAVVIIEMDRGHRGRSVVTSTVGAVMKNPLLLSTLAGLLMSAAGFALPDPVETFFDLLGGAFVPCALFSAGLFLTHHAVSRELSQVSWIIFLKLLVHPLLTWVLAYHIFELNPVYAAVAVIQAALPVGVPVFVLAQHYKMFVEGSSTVIVLSTALSVVSISGWLFVIGV